MIDYSLARRNMVDTQIAVMGVIDPVLLGLLKEIPRERFVPDGWQARAYVDEDLVLPGGFLMIEPMVLARLVQAAEVKSGDRVLCVGNDGGYCAALLSRLAAHVTSASAVPEHGTADGFDVIIVNGAVPAVPESLAASLAAGGRLAAVIRHAGIDEGKATIVTRLAHGALSAKTLFDASIPFLDGQAPGRPFVF